MSGDNATNGALAAANTLSQAVAQKRGTDKELMKLFSQLAEAMARLKNRTDKAEQRAREAEESVTSLMADCDKLRAENRALAWSNDILTTAIQSAAADLKADEDAMHAAVAALSESVMPAVETAEIAQIEKPQLAA